MSDLTRFTMEVHTSDSGHRTLTASFLVNVQQTLMPHFEAACHDEFLRRFHAAGHMPVGPILILTETWIPPAQAPIVEGEPLDLHRTIDDWALNAQGRVGNIVKVTADVELGLSL